MMIITRRVIVGEVQEDPKGRHTMHEAAFRVIGADYAQQTANDARKGIEYDYGDADGIMHMVTVSANRLGENKNDEGDY